MIQKEPLGFPRYPYRGDTSISETCIVFAGFICTAFISVLGLRADWGAIWPIIVITIGIVLHTFLYWYFAQRFVKHQIAWVNWANGVYTLHHVDFQWVCDNMPSESYWSKHIDAFYYVRFYRAEDKAFYNLTHPPRHQQRGGDMHYYISHDSRGFFPRATINTIIG